MTINTVSSNYLATAMLPAVKQAQTQLATLQTETASGQYADLGLQLGAQSGYELSLRNQSNLLTSMTTANSITATNMTSAQNALTSIQSSASDSVKSLVALTSGANSPTTLQSLGTSNLQQLLALANTSSGGDYVFGGQNLTSAPLNNYFSSPSSTAKTAIDTAFQSYFGFSTTSPNVTTITATQLNSFLSGSYALQFQGSNWTTSWSTASNSNMTTQIAPNTTITSSTNANTSGFRSLAQGYTMLSEFGNIGLSASAQQALSLTATNVINNGVSGVIDAQATLGQSQGALNSANAQMSAQVTLLQQQVSSFDSVDMAKIASELTQVSTQLQASYQITSKLSKLNLAQYLPA